MGGEGGRRCVELYSGIIYTHSRTRQCSDRFFFCCSRKGFVSSSIHTYIRVRVRFELPPPSIPFCYWA